MDDLRAELLGERQSFGAASEHRLGADVDGQPGDLGAAELATDLGRALDQQDVAAGGGDAAGRDQTGDPATHHHRVTPHATSLPERSAAPGWT